MKVANAKTLPQVYFGLHMVEGVAEYREPGKTPYRVLIRNEAIKDMDPSFQGRPVYVRHVDEVKLDSIQEDADGYVVRSFFNQADGKHWVEFLVVSDQGHEAIQQKKWKLSNCYTLKESVGGGQWNGVDYAKEVRRGEYDHLAIVPNPRYDSVILTPEQFKQYNSDKQLELSKLSNSKEENKSMLKFFKKQKVENSTDLEGMAVQLPKSGKEITIEQLVKNADEVEMNADKPMMANGDHHVMVGEEKMSVNSLIEKHAACMNELAEMKKGKEGAVENDADAEAKKKALELAAHEDAEMKAKNAEKEALEKKAIEEKKANDLANFEKLKNADKNKKQPEVKIDLMEDQIARGKARYGSN